MAGKIKGITIELGGDTSKFNKAIKDAGAQAGSLQKELRQVDSLLKLDPKNTELLAQKEKLFAQAVEKTKDKVEALKKAKADADKKMENGTEVNEKQYRELQREIVKTEKALESLENESKDTNSKILGIGKAKDGLGKIASAVAPVAKGIAAVGTAAVAAGTAAVAAGTAIVSLGVKAGASADDINTLAKQTGLSTEQIQIFQYASDRIDVSLETLTKSMAKLTKNMFSAQNGSKTIQETFKALGIAIEDNDGKLRNNQDVMNECINALSQIENETQRDAYAMQIFGKSAQELNPLILGGADALNIMATEAKEAGVILSQETLDSANIFNDAVDKIKATSDGIFKKIGSEIAEFLTPAANVVADTLDNVAEGIGASAKGSKKLVEEIKAENEAWEKMKATQKEKLETNLAEIDYTKRLYDELKTLADENGNVTDANKVRVNYILGELNSALGLELKLTGQQIQGYANLGTSIEDMLQKKRAEIILASQEEEYKKAVLEIDKKRNEQAELQLQAEKKQIELNKLLQKMEDGKATWKDLADANNLKGELKEINETYAQNAKVIDEYNGTITKYNSDFEALMSGNADKIKAVNNSVEESFKKHGEATEQELADQVYKAAHYYNQLVQESKKTGSTVTQQQLDDALIQYNNACTEYEKIGKAIPEGMQVGIENGKPTLKTKVGAFIATVKSWFTNKDGFDVNSPSKWSYEIAQWVDTGFANGIVDGISEVKKAFRELFGTVEEEHEDLTEEEKKYNSELERIQKAGTEKTNKAYLETLKKTSENAKKQREEIRSTFEGMLKDVQDNIDKLNSEMNSFKEGLSDVELIGTTTVIYTDDGNEKTVTRTRLADLSPKLKELQTFSANLTTLENIGIDPLMIEQIKELGGEKGSQLAQALVDATPQQRNKFISDYKEIGKLSGEVTAKAFDSEMEKVATDTKAVFDNLTPDLLKVGQDWGTVLGQGITEKMQAVLRELKNSFSSFGIGGVVNSNNTFTINQDFSNTNSNPSEQSEETRRMLQNLEEQGNL